jgi:peptidoglycan glycosyltransferase
MFGFFKKRPGLVVLAFVAVLASGVVAAHRSHSGRQAPPALSLERGREKAPKTVETWRGSLDLDQATIVESKLEQKLEDGTRIRFTIDPALQTHMREFLARYEVPYGVAVAYGVKSGRVLAMASYSHENPKLATQHLSLTPWAPAASVFKVVTSAALLDAGVPATTEVCYHGGFRRLTRRHLHDNPKLDKTCRTLSDALAKSINPIMAKLASRHLDRTALLAWAERFGFNKSIPFDLPTRPSRAKIPTRELERARTAAGFWHTEISPLHGAVIAGLVANRGVLAWPHVVESVTLADGRVVTPPRPEAQRVMHRRIALSLSKMMARTTTIGSGRRGFVSRRGKPYLGDFTVAGKTGSLSRKKPFLQYSWFVGFAPVEKPEIAFAVLLGNPMRWRIKASVGARALLQQYLKQKHKRRSKKSPKVTRRSRTKRKR